MDVDNCVLGAITVSSTLIEVTQQYHQAIKLQLEKVAFCSRAGWNCRVVSNHGKSNHWYSLVHLVVAKLEELISRTLLDLFKIRLLFQVGCRCL